MFKELENGVPNLRNSHGLWGSKFPSLDEQNHFNIVPRKNRIGI